jgi:hypothetical protein
LQSSDRLWATGNVTIFKDSVLHSLSINRLSHLNSGVKK